MPELVQPVEKKVKRSNSIALDHLSAKNRFVPVGLKK
jgi:hypothetical protein